jgi:hypothetical protein
VGSLSDKAITSDRLRLPPALRAARAVHPQVMGRPTSRPSPVASLDNFYIGTLSGMEQMDTEVVETVAGVVRLLRRAAELAWIEADQGGPRSSSQLLALGSTRQRTRDLSCCLAAPG